MPLHMLNNTRSDIRNEKKNNYRDYISVLGNPVT